MAKLSELKKVELLEETVLTNDPEAVKELLNTYDNFEFTARALGLAIRFCSLQITELLLDHGATFHYELTPAFKRKYNCYIALSIQTDIKISYPLFLLSEYPVTACSNTLNTDAVRSDILKLLIERDSCDFEELLYFAILFDETAIYTVLNEANISALSPERIEVIDGTKAYSRMKAPARHMREQLRDTLFSEEIPEAKVVCIFQNLLNASHTDKFIFTENEFYRRDWSTSSIENKEFKERFCSVNLFPLFFNHSNMVEIVHKPHLAYALISQNNAPGLYLALENQWVNPGTEIDDLLAFAEKKHASSEILAQLLELKQVISNNTEKDLCDSFSLDDCSISKEIWEKKWAFEVQEDGTYLITSYKGIETDVIIPNEIDGCPVTAIGKNAFNPDTFDISAEMRSTRTNLKSIGIPETVLKIYDSAFSGCKNIESIVLPDTLIFLDSYAFSGCSSLKKINLPVGIAELSMKVFVGCGFNQFIIPEHIKKIGSGVFAGCKNLSCINLPDWLTFIPDSMFAGCTSLEAIDIPQNIEIIGCGAFSGCSLKTIAAPNCVKQIDSYAFRDCKSLECANLNQSITFGDGVFNGCDRLANDKGQIVVNGVLFGIVDPDPGFTLSAKCALKPLMLTDDIKRIAIGRNELPEILFRENTSPGKKLDISGLSIGDEILFGRFPEKEDYIMSPLKWRVLDKTEDAVLIITVDCIISLSDSLKQKGVWASSSARKLLNEGFYNTAFTDTEKSQILIHTVSTPRNKSQRIDGGPDTEDHVFLLSVEEVKQYMPTNESQESTPTEYARKKDMRQTWGFWQLRTPGKSSFGPVAVHDFGGFSAMTGNYVGSGYLRPAMWIKNK